MCRPFFSLPITATLIIVVVENIELDPSNNPAQEGLRLPTYGPLTKKVAHPCLIILCRLLHQGWRTFLNGGSNLRSQTEKRKNVGHGCNNIYEGLERKFCRNLCKEQKKDFHLRNTQLPIFTAPLWKNSLFLLRYFLYRFFVKIFKLQYKRVT